MGENDVLSERRLVVLVRSRRVDAPAVAKPERRNRERCWSPRSLPPAAQYSTGIFNARFQPSCQNPDKTLEPTRQRAEKRFSRDEFGKRGDSHHDQPRIIPRYLSRTERSTAPRWSEDPGDFHMGKWIDSPMDDHDQGQTDLGPLFFGAH